MYCPFIYTMDEIKLSKFTLLLDQFRNVWILTTVHNKQQTWSNWMLVSVQITIYNKGLLVTFSYSILANQSYMVAI